MAHTPIADSWNTVVVHFEDIIEIVPEVFLFSLVIMALTGVVIGLQKFGIMHDHPGEAELNRLLHKEQGESGLIPYERRRIEILTRRLHRARIFRYKFASLFGDSSERR